MSESGLGSPASVSTPSRLSLFLDRAGLQGFPWVSAIVLYTISWGWLFIVRDSLWSDDWWRYPNHFDYPWSTYGHPPWLRYEKYVFNTVGVAGTHFIIFVGFFLSAVFLRCILQKFRILAVSDRQFLILLFLVLPLNTARVALYTFCYSLPYVLFFFAWYLLINFAARKTYILSVVLFFLSFGMHSLLLFFFLPVLHKFLLSKVGDVRGLLEFARTNFVLLLLPILYWGMRSIFWPEEVAYHDVSRSSLFKTVYFVLITVSLLSIIFVSQLKLKAKKQSLQLIFAGVLCIFFGIYAYVVYGFFSPNWSFFSKYIVTSLGRSDWYSRHQTLQPLGVALLIVGVIGLLPKSLKKFTKQIQALILAVCVVFNVGFGFEYVVDHAKQKEVTRVLKEDGESKSGSDYQFVDQTTLLNARGREYRERDWKGLIWLAYGVKSMQSSRVTTMCESHKDARLVLIRGPETHWEALKNWVSDGDMGFEVTVDDTPGACKPEMVTSERVSGAIPILFYFTGAKG